MATHVDHWVATKNSAGGRLTRAVLNAWNEFARNGTAADIVLKDNAILHYKFFGLGLFLGHWRHGHHGVAVLTATTGLLLKQTANVLGGSSDGLAVRHAWLAHGHIHFHVANQLVFNDFQVQFTHSADDGFARFIVVIAAE